MELSTLLLDGGRGEYSGKSTRIKRGWAKEDVTLYIRVFRRNERKFCVLWNSEEVDFVLSSKKTKLLLPSVGKSFSKKNPIFLLQSQNFNYQGTRARVYCVVKLGREGSTSKKGANSLVIFSFPILPSTFPPLFSGPTDNGLLMRSIRRILSTLRSPYFRFPLPRTKKKKKKKTPSAPSSSTCLVLSKRVQRILFSLVYFTRSNIRLINLSSINFYFF